MNCSKISKGMFFRKNLGLLIIPMIILGFMLSGCNGGSNDDIKHKQTTENVIDDNTTPNSISENEKKDSNESSINEDEKSNFPNQQDNSNNTSQDSSNDKEKLNRPYRSIDIISNFNFVQYPKLNSTSILFVELYNKSIGRKALDINSYDLKWTVEKEPRGSNLKLITKNDFKTVIEFKPKKVGSYVLKVSDIKSNTYDTMGFEVKDGINYKNSDIEGYSDGTDIEDLIGRVKNQYWIYSDGKLNKEQSTKIANKYNLKIISYHKVHGLLVEIIDNHEKIINSIMLEDNVYYVRQKVHIGSNVIKPQSYELPNDGSAFNDDGDNWYLEDINMDKAWALYDGKDKKTIVGIIDNYFFTTHEDLIGKFSQKPVNLLKYEESEITNHGTSTSSIICATANNKKGMSGINQNCQLEAYSMYLDPDPNTPHEFLEKISDKVKVVNNSYSWSEEIPIDADSSKDSKLVKKSFDFIAPAKELIKKDKKLWIFAASNDWNDAIISNGAFHYDYKTKNLQKLSNVIIVAAHYKNNVLAPYSNYGESVDISAPTALKAADVSFDFSKLIDRLKEGKYNLEQHGTSNKYTKVPHNVYGTLDNHTEYKGKAFNGTSAAAPVVTGVASLIFEINPNFTAEDVKNILINSATEKIKKRYKRECGWTKCQYKEADLKPNIPKLDAKAAIEMAIAITEGKKVLTTYEYEDPFSSYVTIKLSSSGKYIVDSFKFRRADSSEFLPADSDQAKYKNTFGENKIVGTATIKNKKTDAKVDGIGFEMELKTPKVSLHIKDKNGNSIEGANVKIEDYKDKIIDKYSTFLYLKPKNTYKIVVQKDGYQKQRKDFYVEDVLDEQNIEFVLHEEAQEQDKPKPFPSSFNTKQDTSVEIWLNVVNAHKYNDLIYTVSKPKHGKLEPIYSNIMIIKEDQDKYVYKEIVNKQQVSAHFTYTPDSGYVGEDKFPFKVANGEDSTPYVKFVTITVEKDTDGLNSKITSLNPKEAKLNKEVTFTILGENLPQTIAMALQDGECEKAVYVSSSKATIVCTPKALGKKDFYVAEKSHGDSIQSDVVLKVNILPNDTNPQYGIMPDIKKNQCYFDPTNIFDDYGKDWYECTRYAYGRACEKMGILLKFTQVGNNHAQYWYSRVKNLYKGDEPRANSIAVWKYGAYGHVAYVEKVAGDKVIISEANWSDPTDGKYNGVKELTKKGMKNRGKNGDYKLLGYIYLKKFPTITLSKVDDIVQGQKAFFKANLSEALENKYSLKIRLGNGAGGFLNPVDMTADASRKIFTYQSPSINKKGNRKYQVGIFDGNTIVSNWKEGTYKVTQKPTPSGDTKVLKTSQTTSYEPFDDGHYQKGVARSYSRANDIVTDNATGLQWQDDDEIKTISKTWEEAKAYCQDLTLGGHTDWRLPTHQELKSIVDYGRYAGDSKGSIGALNPVFENINSSDYGYWSSTTDLSNTNGVWLVDFSDGAGRWDRKSGHNSVRCVR